MKAVCELRQLIPIASYVSVAGETARVVGHGAVPAEAVYDNADGTYADLFVELLDGFGGVKGRTTVRCTVEQARGMMLS